jgi:hypothetical protein
MAVYGISLCDAGFEAAVLDGAESGAPRAIAPEDGPGALGWMGLTYHDGSKFWFGRRAEDSWLIHPRQVCHSFWSRLSREPSTLNLAGKPPSCSQLAYFFLRDYTDKLTAAGGAMDKVALAVPGVYLKDPATEDERIGLLLGIAHELKLPLAGIVDMACAALGDARVDFFDPALPVLHVDVHLHGAEITLLRQKDGRLTRADFACLPQSGYAELLRHITTAMGNRFLRHTTFDILEDGRIEQAFYRQCKQFLLSRAAEHHFQINTANRNYELMVTREQLAADTAAFVQGLVLGAQALFNKSTGRAATCTVALSERAALLPGVASRFRVAGLAHVLRLPAGAAAFGAAALAAERAPVADLTEVPVDVVAPPVPERTARRAPLTVRVLKARQTAGVPPPTHAICEGLGHVLNGQKAFTIGVRGLGVDLPLPEEFTPVGGSCVVRLETQAGRWWLVDDGQAWSDGRTALETGDRLILRWGEAESEVLFAHCAPRHGPRA